MLMAPAVVAVRKHRVENLLRKIPFAYKRASGPFRSETVCPVYEQGCEATELLFGRGGFGGERRLTGFRGARKIIRIRTKCPAAGNANSRR